MRLLLVPLLLAGLMPTVSQADQLTREQLAALFRHQMDDIRAATAEPELGATRGLVLTPVAPAAVDGTAAVAPVTIEAAKGSADTAPKGGLQLGQPDSGAAQTVSAKPEQIQHWTLPKGEQVNYQVKFAFDSAALSPDQKPQLRLVCEAIDAANVKEFRIIGHTDASGDPAYNQSLSVLRAEEVERFFVSDCGIAAGRLEAIGVGEEFPFDANKPSAGINRRVEFQALS